MDESGIIRTSDTTLPAFSSTVLKTEDLGGELQFTATHKIGWLELILTTSVITGCGVYGILRIFKLASRREAGDYSPCDLFVL